MADGLYEVEEIIGRRITVTGKQEFLVHWKKYKVRESTWEPLENICLGSAADFLHRAYPIPGVRPSEILHLKPKCAQPAKQLKLKKLSQMNRRKLRGKKEILDEIMKEEAKELEMKKEQMKGKRRRRQKQTEENEARYVLNDEGQVPVFNGQKTRSLRSAVTTVHNNNTLKKYKSSPRKSKDKALLAMATACVTNNYEWPDRDFLEVKQPAKVAHIRQITETISIVRDGHVTRISICNESKKNAFTVGMCEQMVEALRNAAKDDSVHVVVITGSNGVFCSGLDYSCVFDNCHNGHHKTPAKLLVEKFKLMMEMMINFNKPLVAAVNGDSLGCGTSMVALCDIIYISEKANLQMGFAKWGHTPIGCSSYTLPHLIGRMKACSMLLLNESMTAKECWESGLAMEVFSSKDFAEDVRQKVNNLAAMPPKCIQDTKDLLRQYDQQMLYDVNAEECKILVKYLIDEQGVASMSKQWALDVLA